MYQNDLRLLYIHFMSTSNETAAAVTRTYRFSTIPVVFFFIIFYTKVQLTHTAEYYYTIYCYDTRSPGWKHHQVFFNSPSAFYSFQLLRSNSIIILRCRRSLNTHAGYRNICLTIDGKILKPLFYGSNNSLVLIFREKKMLLSVRMSDEPTKTNMQYQTMWWI